MKQKISVPHGFTLHCLFALVIGAIAVCSFTVMLISFGADEDVRVNAAAMRPAEFPTDEKTLQSLAARLSEASIRLNEIEPAAGR